MEEQTYLPNLIFSHTPVHIYFVQEYKETGSHEPLHQVFSIASEPNFAAD